MPREWYATCKDCGREYGYSDASYQLSVRRGLSRPERCPDCRKFHSREITTLGLSHFELAPILPIPSSGLQAGRLGGLVRPARVHEPRDRQPSFDLNKFGIKDSHIREYFELLQTKQVTVVVAPTGAGKSTFLPYRLMVPPEPFPADLFSRDGQIVITQPRIQATRNIPLFVARDLHGSNLGAGFDVGFRHSGSPSTDWRNRMVYMTDGTLINMIVRNELSRLSVIMIDEAHERSLNIDLILGLLKAQLPRFPNLKLIIASATINAGMFLEYYGGPKGFDPDKFANDTGEGFLSYDNQQIAQALKETPVGFYGFPGKRQYPVETRFREDEPIIEEQWSGRMPDEMAKKILQILRAIQSGEEQSRGDILGFLHGEAPIERAVELIRAGVEDDATLSGQVDVLPLYTKLPQKQQDAALLPKKNKKRLRVVISTNVAETSLTVDGIVHVVDSGLINESQWDSKTQTSFVVPKIHSQSGCKQRWGRGGRIQPGVAHCLYTAEQFGRFPKHTDPEILRAPLDQIILTAKAAGIDDINSFEWIQRPSQDELERSPRFLQQIGAIDEQGDLTDHGAELRSFGEEVDIANLMILADRFGCAIEMATLLPMRTLGGFTKLLLWDKGWDAHTKRAVHKIHQALLDSCVDDIEFSLKIWQCWEGNAFGRTTGREREKWAIQHFVNHHIFREQIAPERESLLLALSGHRKEQVYRSIDFDLLTRLRILMTYGLPNQIYFLDDKQKSELELNQAPVYRPYIAEPGNNSDLELLHSDAVVEVSPDSICSNRAMQLFVCGQRQRFRRRLSPLSEPLTIITASFLTAIKPQWLHYINQPLMNLSRLMSLETRNPSGDLVTTTTAARLFIDQLFPIGATFRCQSTGSSNTIQIGQFISPAPHIQPRKSNEDIDAPVDIEYLEAEKAIQTTGVTEEDQKYIVDVQNDVEETPEWVDVIEESRDESHTTEATSTKYVTNLIQTVFPGRVVHTLEDQILKSEFRGVVTGYDFSNHASPVILLEIPDEPAPFDRFYTHYKAGENISVKVISIEQYVNDRLAYLVVREEKSALEMIMDPYDASLGGRNFAIEMLKPGDMIETTIEDIDTKAKRVKINRLRQAEEEHLRFIGKGDERIIDATIVEVRDNGLYLWLNPEVVRTNIPISAFVYIDRLPQRPEEMWLGRSCKVKVRIQQFKREIRRGVGNLPEKAYERIRQFPWDKKLRYEEETSRIIAGRRITYDQRLTLLRLSSQSEYQKAVNIIYRRSNEVEARVLDMTGIENLTQYEGQRLPEKWKVTKVLDDAVLVAAPDGFETVVPKREVVYDLSANLHEAISEGIPVDITVKQVDVPEGRVDLSLLRPEDDPLNKYQVGQVVTGHVANIISSGAFVELEPGVQGMVHISEVAWWRIDRVETVLHKGQGVTVWILDIDRQERKLKLTMRLAENDPLRNYHLNQIVLGKVVAFTKDGSGTFVELAPGVEGFVYKDEISFGPVQDAREILQEGQTVIVRISELDLNERRMRLTIRGLYETTFQVPTSHIRLIKGRGGATIIQLTNETQTRIDLEDDGACKIQGLNQQSVEAAKQRIEKILETRMITFGIQELQARRLVGKGGNTIKAIQDETGAQIHVDSKTHQVVITAENNLILQRCLDQIRNIITFYQTIIRVPSNMVGRVIGPGGSNVKAIAQTGVQVDISRDDAGLITVEGRSRSLIDQALQQIRYHAGTVEYIRVIEADMPTYKNVKSEEPKVPQVLRPQRMVAVPSRLQSLPTASQPTRPSVPQAVAQNRSQYYQSQMQIDTRFLPALLRKENGFLISLFGGGKSILDKIMEESRTQIKVNSTTGIIIITGHSQSEVDVAVCSLQVAMK
jgi:HrpA-like RNA helicase/ribosomal protein S1